MSVYTIQPSFSGGEFSPSLYSRVDVQKYATGLKKAKNFIIHPHGGASNRSGTEYVAEGAEVFGELGGEIRLIPFEYSIDQAYVLEFGHLYIRVIKDGGLVLNGMETEVFKLTTTYREEHIKDIKYTQSVDVLYLFHPEYPPRVLTRYASNAWTISDFAFTNGPFMPEMKEDPLVIQPSSTLGEYPTHDTAYTLWDYNDSIENASNYSQIVKKTLVIRPGTLTFEGRYFASIPGNHYVQVWINGVLKHQENFTVGIGTLETFTYTILPADAGNKQVKIVLYSQDLDTEEMAASALLGSLSVPTYRDSPPLGLMLKNYNVSINTGIVPFFTLGHVGSLVKVNQFSQSSTITQTITGNIFVPPVSLIVKGTWRLATRGTWAGTITVLRSAPNSYVGWEPVKTFSHNTNDYNLDAFGEEDEICRMAIGMDNFSTGPCYVDLSCDSFSHHGVVKITEWVDALNCNGVVTTPVMQFRDVLSWQEGSWSIKRGFPSCGAFYQDRLAIAATPSEPETTWLSKTGNYVDFGVSSPLEDTDAVSINLPSRKMNGIKNLVSLSEILALTSASECGIGDSGGVFTPTTARTRVHGYRGSSDVMPALVGNRAITVQSMGSVVRDFGYDFQSDGFAGSDLSIFSSHLFKGYSIVEMAYQQEPDSIVWCVRSDGKCLAMTYMKEQDVVAWSWIETDGLFESVCCIPGDGQNDVYFVVNRGGHRFIEKLSKRLPVIDSEEATFLDSFLTYRGDATTTISGLEHLEGKTVTALSNGRVVKNLLVNDGEITLPVPATIVHVGLPYVSDFQTLSIQVPMQDGASYGRLVKVAEAKFTFLNSRGGFIGPDENSLDEIIELSGAYLGDPRALFSGDYKQTMASGYEEGGEIFFRQSDPLPVTILSIMPKITVGG